MNNFVSLVRNIFPVPWSKKFRQHVNLEVLPSRTATDFEEQKLAKAPV